MHLYNKFLITIVISFAVFLLGSITPKTALAIPVPVLDGPVLAQNTLLTNKELVLDPVVTAAAKVVISNITNSLITWINSGFEGNPAFISNPEQYFTDVADQVAGNFIAGGEMGELCQPFSNTIRINLAVNYSSNYVQRNFCRLSDIIGDVEGYTDFTNGNFGLGGWNSWFEITQNPSNNPLGAQVIAQSEMAKRIAKAVGIKEKELDWGDGFLSFRDCLAEDRNGNCVKQGPIKTPGKVIESQLENTLGSDIRQLELADEFNEIISALVGQLVQKVFISGLSSGPTANYSGGQTAVQVPLSVSCSPNNSVVAVGSSVTWSALVYGGTGNATTYLWRGDPAIEGETGQTVRVIYTEPGTKSASVKVTKGGQNISTSCTSSVEVQ